MSSTVNSSIRQKVKCGIRKQSVPCRNEPFFILVESSLERIRGKYDSPESGTTDRGFDAAANDLVLEKLAVFNGICPKSPHGLLMKRQNWLSLCVLPVRCR